MKRVFAAVVALCVLLTGALAEVPAEAPAEGVPATAVPTTSAPETAKPETPAPEPVAPVAPAAPSAPAAPDAPAVPTEPAAPSAPADTEGTPTPEPADTPPALPPSTEGALIDALADPGLDDGGDEGPGIPADAEAWMIDPDDAENTLFGKLADLIKDFDEDTEATVYIRSDKLMKVKDKVPDDLKKTVLLPDPDVFLKDKYEVHKSDSDPTAEPPTEGDDPGTPEVWLYVWVEKKETPPPGPVDPPGEMSIFVDATDYKPGEWSNLVPKFELSSTPELPEGYTYAAIAYDKPFVVLSGNTHAAGDQGSYTLRFAILDSIGDIVAMSTKFELKLDFTPPAYVAALLKEEGKAVFHVSSADALSGIEGYSVDGGETWVPVGTDGGYTHTGKLGDIYAPGMILARDNAGNTAEYPGEFAIPKPEPIPDGGGFGGGGGGGGGDGTPKIKHTGDSDVDTTPYDALDLEISGDPMHALTIGGEALELALLLDNAEDFDIADDYAPQFTARLTRWSGESDEDAPDTLVLDALIDPAFAGEYTYLWQFNGAVYRMLFNSGIDYLVLSIGDHVMALSTAGFTAGTEYTKLKAGGVSTRKFEYSIWMTGSALDASAGDIVVEASVDGEIYPLTESADQPMYHYDLYYGPAELLDAPFGAWQLEKEGTS